MADYVITLQTPDTQVVTVTEPQTTVLPSNLVPVTPLYNNAVSAQTASLAVLSLSANTASLALSANAALFATSASRAAMAGTFTSGSATNLTAGTLPDARLSSNVPLKNAANTFTANQVITGTVTANGASLNGNLFFPSDSANDIGGTSSNRPRDVFVGRNLGVSGVSTITGGLSSSLGLTINNWGIIAPSSNLTVSYQGFEHTRFQGLGNPISAGRLLIQQYSTGTSAASYPAYSFLQDSNTGIIRWGEDDLAFVTSGSARWRINPTGDLIAVTDNSNDIGASAANRPRDVYVGRNLVVSGDTTITGELNFGNGVIKEQYTNFLATYRNLGTYTSDAQNVTGSIVIKTAIPAAVNRMCRVVLTGYHYDSTGPFELAIGFYRYGSGDSFINSGYTSTGIRNWQVRLGKSSDGYVCLFLDDVASRHDYLKLWVSEFMVGYTGYSDAYARGWTITNVTDLTDYTLSVTVPDRTSVNATNIISGSLADARLSSNVPLKNAANVFTTSNIFESAAASSNIRVRVPGDADYRFRVLGNGQLVWGDGALAGDANLYRSGAAVLKTDGALVVSGDGSFGGTLSITGAVTSSGNATFYRFVTVDGGSGVNKGLRIYKDGLARWALLTQTTAESGNDAGSPLSIYAYTDSGSFIDVPLTITRAAGGSVAIARPTEITTAELFDLTLNGSATGQRQIRLGGTYGSTLGTRYSGADLWLAWNAHQNIASADSWTASTSATLPSVATRHHLGGWSVYYAPIGKPTGSMTAFWGSPLLTVGTSGNLLVSGNIDFNGSNTADIGALSPPRDVFVGRNLSVTGTPTFGGVASFATGLDSYGAINTRNGGNAIRMFDSGSITHGYLSFHTTGSVRKGWLGYGSNGTNVLNISNEIAGGPIYLSPSGSYIRLDGQLDFSTDGTADIGRSSSNRPRNLYLGGSVLAGGAVYLDGISRLSTTPTYTLLSDQSGSYAVYLNSANSYYDSTIHTFRNTGGGSQTTMRVLGGATFGYAQSDATTTFQIGYGGSSPTSNRAVSLILDSPHTSSFGGAAQLLFRRDGTTLWQIGYTPSVSGAKTSADDLHFYNGSAFVAALSQTGALRLSGGLSYTTDNAVDIGSASTNRPRHGYFGGTVMADTGFGVGASPGASYALNLAGSNGSTFGANITSTADGTASLALVRLSAGTTNTASGYVGAYPHSHTNSTLSGRLAVIANSDAKGLILWTGGSGTSILIAPSGTPRWAFSGSGAFLAVTDNSVDIGTSTDNRPRDVFIARNLAVGGTITGTVVASGSISNANTLNGQSGSYYLSAGNLTGTVLDARLSSNVPFLNALNTFTSQQTVNGTTRHAFKAMATNEWSGPDAAGAYGLTQGATVISGSTSYIQHYFAYRATHAVYARSGSGEYGFYTQGPYAHPVIEVMAGGHALTGWASDSPMRDFYLYQQVKGPAQSATTASVRITNANSSWLFGVQNTLNFVIGGGLVHNGAVVLNSGSLQNVSINAALLDSGTLADTRLSSNVPLKNTSNSFTGALTASAFSGNGAGISGVVSASYATTSSYALAVLGGTASASYASTAGFATLAATASYVTAANVAGTVANAVTATTASYVNAVNVKGTVAAAATASYSAYLTALDDRIVSASDNASRAVRFGFGSWANNNTNPYADWMHLRTYSDQSGGSDNLVMFRKDTFGMRIYQAPWNSTGSYTNFRDLLTYDSAKIVDEPVIIFQTVSGSAFKGDGSLLVNLGTAATASYVSAGNVAGTVANATNAVTATTASYVSAVNVKGTVANATSAATASYVLASSVVGTVAAATSATTATSASFATNSINTTVAVTASYVAAANVKGTVASASFAQNALTANSATSATTATTASFFNMSNATMGTLDSARLPTNVARNDLANTFTLAQTINGNVVFGGALQTLAQSAGTNLILQTSVTGDSNQRLQLDANGKLLWGSGAAVGDTNLYRSAAGTLKTDGSLVATGTVTVSGSMTVGGRNVSGQVVSTSAPSGSAPEGTVWYQV